jgi:hypothetical protein
LARCITAFTVSGTFVPQNLDRERAFPCKGAGIAGDVVGGLSIAVLDRDLHVVESGLDQRAQRLFRDANRRRNKIGIKTGRMGPRGDVHEITSRPRLAARQMHLQHAERDRFTEHSQPGRGI